MIDINDKFGIKSTQLILLELLIKFDKFCNKYDIKYSLDSGTLLGCVRDNGFIPWDDDIDINMSRVEYDKFMKVYNTKLDEFSEDVIIKIIGFIPKLFYKNLSNFDLIVYDNVPNVKIAAFTKLLSIKILQTLIKIKNNGGYHKGFLQNTAYYFLFVLSIFFTKIFLLRTFNFVSQIGNKNRCDFITSYSNPFHQLGVYYPNSIFNEYVKKEFEGFTFIISAQYDLMLTKLYGDYLTLPPIEERVPFHS